MWGDPEEIYFRWSGSIGHHLHQNMVDLLDRPWREFCYWVTVAKAYEDANTIEL